MGFTQAATSELARFDKSVSYKLELSTNAAEGPVWQEYAFEDFSLTRDANAPAVLTARLCNDALSFSDEDSAGNRTQLLANARLTCSVGSDSEVLFSGRIFRVEPKDCSFSITAQDWLALINDCECEVSATPDETAELPRRQLFLAGGGAFGSAYGFSYTGAGDPAFNLDANPGTRRRSWMPGDIRLYYDSSGTEEVPPRHYQANLTSGTVSILEDTTGNTYYASGVRCAVEGTLDWSQVIGLALAYPKSLGGIGAQGGELDLPFTGLSVAGPVYYRGRVSGLLKAIFARQQQNLRLWYDSAAGKLKLRLIEQQSTGNEDWELLHAQSVSQPRDIRDLYSRVVVTGLSERPLNALALPATTLTDNTSQGDWFAWDGLNVGADDTFANVAPLVHDGDVNLGASVHNLAESENGGTDQYDSWYDYIIADFGEIVRVSRLRATTPGSRNYNAAAGHQGLFWPGIRIYGSEDGSDYRLVTALLAGRFPPGETIEVTGCEILMSRLRYLKVQLGAYKHGFENQDDPSIGLAELEVYTTEEYRVVKEIDGAEAPESTYSYTADYDGDGTVDSWVRNHPGLHERLGGRHRTLFDDQTGNLNEYLAHDRAIDLLAESVRLFQQVVYRAVCDPRIRLYDTVVVNDELNGDVGSILVERIELRPSGTTIGGTNYLAGGLGS
jgi:hypothetical protein